MELMFPWLLLLALLPDLFLRLFQPGGGVSGAV